MGRARSPAQASINAISFPTQLAQLERFFYADEQPDETVGWATEIDLWRGPPDKD